ncbi:MAG TPA: hypothetical protein VFR31_09685 [Thermoanaerobaculia bacterium]|nr:hypothetical protein [Thermoanaerobaculia bacterium]
MPQDFRLTREDSEALEGASGCPELFQRFPKDFGVSAKLIATRLKVFPRRRKSLALGENFQGVAESVWSHAENVCRAPKIFGRPR